MQIGISGVFSFAKTDFQIAEQTLLIGNWSPLNVKEPLIRAEEVCTFFTVASFLHSSHHTKPSAPGLRHRHLKNIRRIHPHLQDDQNGKAFMVKFSWQCYMCNVLTLSNFSRKWPNMSADSTHIYVLWNLPWYRVTRFLLDTTYQNGEK
jgi:hypothetical protein